MIVRAASVLSGITDVSGLSLARTVVNQIRNKAESAGKNQKTCLHVSERCETLVGVLQEHSREVNEMRMRAVVDEVVSKLVAINSTMQDIAGQGPLTRLLRASKTTAEIQRMNLDVDALYYQFWTACMLESFRKQEEHERTRTQDTEEHRDQLAELRALIARNVEGGEPQVMQALQSELASEPPDSRRRSYLQNLQSSIEDLKRMARPAPVAGSVQQPYPSPWSFPQDNVEDWRRMPWHMRRDNTEDWTRWPWHAQRFGQRDAQRGAQRDAQRSAQRNATSPWSTPPEPVYGQTPPATVNSGAPQSSETPPPVMSLQPPESINPSQPSNLPSSALTESKSSTKSLSLPRHNHLRIHREFESIIDTFVIDPSLPPLERHGMGRQGMGMGRNGMGKALSLYAEHGNVDATIHLAGAVFRGTPVDLEAESEHGWVRLAVAERPAAMPIKVSVTCQHNSAMVYLPPDFQGPLTIRYEHGKVTILPSLAARLRVLSEMPQIKNCWVGEAPERRAPQRDECVVDNENGDVWVGLFGEEEAEQGKISSSRRGGVLKWFGIGWWLPGWRDVWSLVRQMDVARHRPGSRQT